MESPIQSFALIAIYLMVITLTLYGVALGYHLLNYGEKRSVALSALMTYTIGSILLVVAMFIAVSFI